MRGLVRRGAEARMIWQPRAELKRDRVLACGRGERASAGLRGVARGAHTLCRRAGEGREAGSRRERQGRGARVEWRRVGWVGKEDTWAFDGGAAVAGNAQRWHFLTAAQRWPCMNKANKMLQHCAFTDWLEVNCMRKWSDSK